MPNFRCLSRKFRGKQVRLTDLMGTEATIATAAEILDNWSLH